MQHPVAEETEKTIENHPGIITTGYQEDIRLYLALSDIMVFPSYREGFPNVVLQGGAMDLPVIATDINGCNEIIQHGENGLLIPPKDKEQLYLKMKELVANPARVEQLRINARQRIVSRYDRLKMWDNILAEYKQQEANL